VPWQTGCFDVEFTREGTAADARAIRLGDSQHVMQHPRTDPRSGGGLAGNTVRRGDKGISTVIDVEQGALGAFEEQIVAGLVERMQRRRDIGDQRLDLFGIGHRLRENGIEIDRLAPR
jgi:hypothetical protein